MRNRFPLSGLNSRVARRLFLLLLLAALLPAGTLAFLAYVGVEGGLVEAAHRRMAIDAKSQGMQIIQRLRWVEHVLAAAASDSSSKASSAQRWTRLGRPIGIQAFQAIAPDAVALLNDRQREHLAQGKGVLQLDRILQPTMLFSGADGRRVVAAALDPEIIWGEESQVESFCILTPFGKPLYCTPGYSPPEGIDISQLTAANSRGTGAPGSKPSQLGGFWHARLDPFFASDGFIVIVGAERADVTAELSTIWRVFPAVMVLAVALALLLAVSQIRRQIGPLNELEAKTRLLAEGNFTGRIELDGNDEFASLARSFNRTSESLKLQFHLLRTLSDLDRAILDTATDELVIEKLLKGVNAAGICIAPLILTVAGEGVEAHMLGADGQVERSQADPALRHLFSDQRTAQPAFSIKANDDNPASRKLLRAEGPDHALVFPARTKDGPTSLVVLTFSQRPDDYDEIVKAGCSLADRLSVASTNRDWREALYRQANHDALTQLPNRTMLRDRMEQAILRTRRDGTSIITMLIDLDDFKNVNDSLGHTVGDALLVAIAARLKSIARASDTIARLGGDEFVLAAPDVPPDHTTLMAERLVQAIHSALALPFDLGTSQMRASASIGIAVFPDNAQNFDDLLKAADAAMYESKRTDRGSYRFFSNRMNDAVRNRFELVQAIRDAFETQEFFLVFQPKVEAYTHRIVGVEALARWNSKQRGLVPPVEFIPIVDSTGLGNRFGAWVIDKACARIIEWRRTLSWNGRVSVNVSPSQFESGDIIRHVRDALDRYGLPPDALEIEVLESMAVTDFEKANTTLSKLREMGISVALDDFGTGYSSLIYLTELRANVLKIDRAFITNLVSSKRQQAITERIISLAKTLGFEVVAEGVETLEQETILSAMGCDVFQGYLFSRPLSAPDLEKLIVTGFPPLERPHSATIAAP